MRSVASFFLVSLAWLSSMLFCTPAPGEMISTPDVDASKARDALARAVLDRAESLGVADRIPVAEVKTASTPQLAMMLEGMNTHVHAGQVEFIIGFLLIAGVVCIFVLLMLPGMGGGGGGGGGSSTGDGSSGSGLTYDCRSCGGDGICPNCNGSGSTSSGTCVWCGGKRYCGRCGGTGIDK